MLESLSPEERRRLKKFVRSPYFVQHGEVVRLFDFLYDPRQPYDRARAWRAVRPGEAFDEARLRHVMSWLTEAVRQFLTAEELRIDGERSGLLLARSLARRGLERYAARVREEVKSNLDGSAERTFFHFEQQFLLEKLEFEAKVAQRRTGDFRLTEQSRTFSTLAVAEVLRMGSAARSAGRMAGEVPRVELLEEVLLFIEKNGLPEEPVVAAQFHGWHAMGGDAGHFLKLKEILETSWQAFPPSEARDLWLTAINFCIRQHNAGEADKTLEALNLYKKGLKNGVFLDSGTLSLFTYTNIHSLAMLTGERDWAKEFLEKYAPFLPVGDRENYHNYNLANHHFGRRDWGRVLETLQSVDFQEVLQNLNARKMLLVSYFELGEADALGALLESFGLFLRRHKKEVGYHSAGYENLIRFARKLLIVNGLTTKGRDKLRAEIEGAEAVVERKWLLSKLVS